MRPFFRPYCSLAYNQYAHYAYENQYDVLPLAPPDWESHAKTQYLVNTLYFPAHLDAYVKREQLSTTFYVLNKLSITHTPNVTIQLVMIKNIAYLNPYFKGIGENIIFNQYCFVPDYQPDTQWIEQVKLKIRMLGGQIQERDLAQTDILITPGPAYRQFPRIFVDYPELRFHHCVNITLLNQIFRHYFNRYKLRK